MLDRGFPKRDRTSTRTEGLEVKLDSCRVQENMTIFSLEADEVVGPCDENAAGYTLESLCSISAHFFHRMCG
jgi:hypothetical protein